MKYKIKNIVFTADEKAELFLRELSSIVTSDDSGVILCGSRELLEKCVNEPDFAYSLKAFLDTGD
jgi:hypothetical protein